MGEISEGQPEQNDAVDRRDEALGSRLNSAPTHVRKIAMLFEACRCVLHGTNIKEITLYSLELAIKHVDENLRSAAFLESIAERSVIDQRAELVLATVRRKFPVMRPSTIYATRSQLTYELCKHGNRQGEVKTEELYSRIIPYLTDQGLSKMVLKNGKLEVFAFKTEEQLANDQAANSPFEAANSPFDS
jgi:hypothetical protein